MLSRIAKSHRSSMVACLMVLKTFQGVWVIFISCNTGVSRSSKNVLSYPNSIDTSSRCTVWRMGAKSWGCDGKIRESSAGISVGMWLNRAKCRSHEKEVVHRKKIISISCRHDSCVTLSDGFAVKMKILCDLLICGPCHSLDQATSNSF